MNKRQRPRRQVAPGIWKLNKNDYAIRIQAIDPATGKRKNRKWTLKGSSLAEAKRVRQEKLAEVAAMAVVQPQPTVTMPATAHAPVQPVSAAQPWAVSTPETAQVTLGDFAASWLERKIRRGDLQRQTQDRYAVALDRLSPRLRDMRIGHVTPAEVERWMVAAREEFAPITINSWRRVLRTLFNDARHELGLLLNPVEAVKPLREPVNLEDPNAISPVQLRKLLEAVRKRDRTLYAAVLTQALTGMRWQEVSALHREDIDWQQRMIYVRRKAIHGEVVPTTKTGCGRQVGVSPKLLAELRAYLRWLDESDPKAKTVALLFFGKSYRPLHSSRVSVVLKQARADAGIEVRLTSHGLRRTMTDLLRQAHVDPVLAKQLVGHCTDSMRQHYSTVAPHEAREAADSVSSLVFPTETATDSDGVDDERSAAE